MPDHTLTTVPGLARSVTQPAAVVLQRLQEQLDALTSSSSSSSSSSATAAPHDESTLTNSNKEADKFGSNNPYASLCDDLVDHLNCVIADEADDIGDEEVVPPPPAMRRARTDFGAITAGDDELHNMLQWFTDLTKNVATKANTDAGGDVAVPDVTVVDDAAAVAAAAAAATAAEAAEM
jgi:hypothetical protein